MQFNYPQRQYQWINYSINVPVVYMAQDLMILRGQIHCEGPLEGWALKIETFFGH
jgi:hypothetical protein